MNILIIGCGYIGLAAGRALREKGHTVTGTTRSKDKLAFIEKHLNNAILTENLPQALKENDIILFTAAADNSALYKETYLDNARLIAEHCPEKHIIYTGSTSVYGEHHGKEVHEDTPLAPLTPQSQILIDTENTLRALPKSTIFRLGEIIGPGRTIEDRLQKATTMAGTGESITNFSPLSDILKAILFAIENNLTGTYNLCSPLHAQRKELYNQITKAKKLPPVTWDPKVPSLHRGNKRVLSDKLIAAGFTFEALPWEGILNPTT